MQKPGTKRGGREKVQVSWAHRPRMILKKHEEGQRYTRALEEKRDCTPLWSLKNQPWGKKGVVEVSCQG